VILFITGTDTGVGKTLLTALLLNHLRESGTRALAMKPFCSGGRGDLRLLQSLQPGALSDTEMNPFYFDEPLAPFVAAKTTGRVIRLQAVVTQITRVAAKCDCLLIEGSGGLLVPLGKSFTAADLISRLQCRVLVAARNRLGVINHTLLTVQALRASGVPAKQIAVALMAVARPDPSARTNQATLAEWLNPVAVPSIPFLGRHANRAVAVKQSAPRLAATLNALAGFGK
jgi:dethiobiotin synthetase